MECPYHHKRRRAQLQQLLNVLRSEKLVQNKHARQFSAAVCTCTDKGRSPSLQVLDTLPSLHEWVEKLELGPQPPATQHRSKAAQSGGPHGKKVEEQRAGKISDSAGWGGISPILRRYLDDADNFELNQETRAGLVGVVSLVQNIYQGDYHRLEPQLTQTPAKAKEKKEEEDSSPDTLVLSLAADHFGVFVGKGGQHLKALCKEYGVSVQLVAGEEEEKEDLEAHTRIYGVRRRLRKRMIQGQVVKAVIQCLPTETNSTPNPEGFKSALVQRAALVSQRRRHHEQDCSAYLRLYAERGRVLRQKRLQKQLRTRPLRGIYNSPKEAATGHFEKKQQHSAKQQKAGSKGRFAALSDGRCLHCMAPYEPDKMAEGECVYHGGFLVGVKPTGRNRGYQWTCCDKRTAEASATHILHSQTGCSKGRHIWRAGKASRDREKAGRPTEGHRTADFAVM